MTASEKKASILVVEDDQLLAQGIADILSIEGYRVDTAPNGRAAFVKMKLSTPDLVLSDIMMPEMDGHEFCELVRANRTWRTLPFIFLTALGQKIHRRRGLEVGADAYLTKPFEPDDLLVAVRAQLKRAAEHRAAADEALSDMRTSILTTLNHEFRTPLTYITGYSRLLADEGPNMDEEGFQSCVYALTHGADRLKRLVENILLVNQIELGELDATVKLFPQHTLNLSATVHAVIVERCAQAEEKRVVVHHDVPADLPPLAIGDEYVSQIVDHLLENAIKFSNKEGGQVTTSATLRGSYVELVVSDDGIGIRTDALVGVFDTFRQVDRHKQEQQGAGMGLAIVRGLAEAHGGQVSIESEHDVGTTVTVQLPVLET